MHAIAELSGKTEYWLGNQGRLSEPVVIREPGGLGSRTSLVPTQPVPERPSRSGAWPTLQAATAMAPMT
jgi:hypothetical protein